MNLCSEPIQKIRIAELNPSILHCRLLKQCIFHIGLGLFFSNNKKYYILIYIILGLQLWHYMTWSSYKSKPFLSRRPLILLSVLSCHQCPAHGWNTIGQKLKVEPALEYDWLTEVTIIIPTGVSQLNCALVCTLCRANRGIKLLVCKKRDYKRKVDSCLEKRESLVHIMVRRRNFLLVTLCQNKNCWHVTALVKVCCLFADKAV